MIVVDANVTAYLMLEGDRTPLARDVFRCDPEWLAPPIWPHEFVNILATYAKRDRRELAGYLRILDQALSLVDGYKDGIEMAPVLDLAVTHQLSAYDAQYVYLAQMRRLPLITEDTRILRAAPNVAMSMADYIKNTN